MLPCLLALSVLIHITRVTTHPSHLIVIPVYSSDLTLSVLTRTHTHRSNQVISSSSLATHSHHLCYHAHSSPPVLTSLLLPLTHTSVLTLSVLTLTISHRVSPHALTHPRVLSHLTSLSAHTHHLSSHTHHLTSSVTTRTLTSFSLVSPH